MQSITDEASFSATKTMRFPSKRTELEGIEANWSHGNNKSFYPFGVTRRRRRRRETKTAPPWESKVKNGRTPTNASGTARVTSSNTQNGSQNSRKLKEKLYLTKKRTVLFAVQRRTRSWCHTGDTTTSVQKSPPTKQKYRHSNRWSWSITNVETTSH